MHRFPNNDLNNHHHQSGLHCFLCVTTGPKHHRIATADEQLKKAARRAKNRRNNG